VTGLIATIVCLLVTLPLIPSMIAGFSDFGRVADGGRTMGYVRVEGCERGAFIVNWTCHGTFGYADPGGAAGAQPSTTYPDIVIANGFRHYATGESVSVSLRLGTQDAYRSGTMTTFALLGLGLLVLYQVSVLLVVGVLALRKSRVSLLGPTFLVVLTALATYGAWHTTSSPVPAGPPPAVMVSPTP
jgi:hypothetical protein